MEFSFDLQLFAETVVNNSNYQEFLKNPVVVKAGDSVNVSVSIELLNLSLSYKLENHSDAAVKLSYAGGKICANWEGEPGAEGYVTTNDGGKISTYTSLDNKGTYIKLTEGEGNNAKYSYARKDDNARGVPGYSYKDLSKMSSADQAEINRAETYQRTKITDLDFNKTGATTAYYSLAGEAANNSSKVTVANISYDSSDAGLKGGVFGKGSDACFRAADVSYLKVTADTSASGVSTLQVKVMKASKGKFSDSTEQWKGTLTLSGVKNAGATSYNEKYATLKYAKPAYQNTESVKTAWKLKVTDVAIGSVFTGLSANDYVDTAATGNAGVTLKGGTSASKTYNIYNMNNGKRELRTVNVSKGGSVKVKTSGAGKLTYLSGLNVKGEKVTVKDGNTTVSYAYNGSVVNVTATVTTPAKKKGDKAKTSVSKYTVKGSGSTDVIKGTRHYYAAGIKTVKKGKKTVKVKPTNSFTSSIYNDVIHCNSGKDIFTTGAGKGKDKVLGFGVGDVIKLNNLNPKDISALKGASAAGLKKLLAGGLTFANGGSLTVSTKATLRYNAKTKQITAK